MIFYMFLLSQDSEDLNVMKRFNGHIDFKIGSFQLER